MRPTTRPMPNGRPATSPGRSITAAGDSEASGSNSPGPPTPTLQKRHSTNNFTTHGTTAPPRPPRNPARTSVAGPPKPRKTKRPSTATGAREEVTPWEFYPANTSAGGLPTFTSGTAAKQSSSTATGKREDVLPWELFPAPDYDAAAKPVINEPPQTNHTRQLRLSSSSILSFHDMALLRRRKSTGTKTPQSHATPVPPVPSGSGLPNGLPRPSASSNPPKPPSLAPKAIHKTPSTATVRPPLLKAASGPVSTSSAETIIPSPPAQTYGQDPKFSTVDRTILKELKRNISARASQFVIKGGPAESGRAASGASFARLGTRHHAYDRNEVPYPRSYAREVLDLDVWETMACQKICDSLTWHVFPTPPTKVLDIGCGTGTWILNAGMAWKDCHFVGMDIVPLHPDLGGSELSTRITWVQANFLQGLPFPNDEFDFVHIKRIALGVPEDKWDTLFEEISRVLKSGGAFELIEEDLFFPGKTSDDEGDSDSDVMSELRYARRGSLTSDDDESVMTGSAGSRVSHDGSAPTPNTSLGAIPATPPRTASPLPTTGGLIREEAIEGTDEKANLLPDTKRSPPHHRHSYQPRISSPALPPGHPRPVSSLFGPAAGARGSKSRGYSTSTLMQHPSVFLLQSSPSQTTGTVTGGTRGSSFAPFLLRSLPKAPPNPRDHSLLEGIYNEMNATRFINLSPLSLLASLVGLHFKDVRTHPPLQLTFPPPAAQPPLEDDLTSEDDDDSDSDSDSDLDHARNAIVPSPRRRQSILSGITTLGSVTAPPRSALFGDESITDENRWLNTKDLLKRESRYISLDDARMSAFSPSNRSSFPALSPIRAPSGLPVVDPPAPSGGSGDVHPAASGKLPVRTEAKNRLPNATLNIDVRSLNMHLAVRTAEILACSESMWEWVVSYQTSFNAERTAGRPRAGSLASELVPQSSRLPMASDPAMDGFKSAVLELAREDFDGLLVKFEMDMKDHMAIGSTLRDQFSWSCTPLAPSPDRKAFLAACDRWEQWKIEQRRKVKLSPHERHQSRNPIDTPYQTGHENGAHAIPNVRGRSSLLETASRRTTSSSNSIPPDRRLSRSIRVFAAWKP